MDVASNLGSGTMFFFIKICLGNPHLELFLQKHCYIYIYMFTRAGQKSFLDVYVVFLLVVCLLLQTSSNLGSTYHVTSS